MNASALYALQVGRLKPITLSSASGDARRLRPPCPHIPTRGTCCSHDTTFPRCNCGLISRSLGPTSPAVFLYQPVGCLSGEPDIPNIITTKSAMLICGIHCGTHIERDSNVRSSAKLSFVIHEVRKCEPDCHESVVSKSAVGGQSPRNRASVCHQRVPIRQQYLYMLMRPAARSWLWLKTLSAFPPRPCLRRHA